MCVSVTEDDDDSDCGKAVLLGLCADSCTSICSDELISECNRSN